MNFKQFAPNLYISDNPEWKEYREEYIFDLLKSVDINFSKALGTVPYQSIICFIDHTEGNPLCAKIKQFDYHLIKISAYDDYLSRWVYEFSHEYCHHLINGAFEADIIGLIWFEETICEMSSMYHLHKTADEWHHSIDPNKLLNYHSFLECLHDLLTKNQSLVNSTYHQRWLQSWLPFLSEPKHHRNHNNAIAARMLPLFLENPYLWKIILHFGDMRKWNSIYDLFDHLFDVADGSYSDHLKKLYDLLLL